MFPNPEEYFYLYLLSQWQRTAPPEKHQGETTGGLEKPNTQTTRMAWLLWLVAGPFDARFEKLAKRTELKDGRSYVSNDPTWMNNPCEIGRGWFFEGNMSLSDKQSILKDLPLLGLASREFVRCAQDFVAGQPIQKYWPVSEQSDRLLEALKRKAERESS